MLRPAINPIFASGRQIFHKANYEYYRFIEKGLGSLFARTLKIQETYDAKRLTWTIEICFNFPLTTNSHSYRKFNARTLLKIEIENVMYNTNDQN